MDIWSLTNIKSYVPRTHTVDYSPGTKRSRLVAKGQAWMGVTPAATCEKRKKALNFIFLRRGGHIFKYLLVDLLATPLTKLNTFNGHPSQ